ncbi:hypothetical protein CEG14_15570 [Bordetella genomosp. 1]|uniref:NTP pyrophosphohydrolase n=1 Tax=Bordetella genomosp. 1 TaxID=1395607 RepID=A0A261SGA4_9BORD|nr:hypothetical protein [Bordetella genomosp. 1]OZI36416.1 hypothetical protein CEG14_15570 [Bordetella genomosp. 1]OZI57872.1 hypothetical protein CAL27_20960 [Bordetella genomosp. 1]
MNWASLPGGEDWLMAPVIRGLVSYDKLLDGSIGLVDIALMNDALWVQADNQMLARRAWEEKNGR